MRTMYRLSIPFETGKHTVQMPKSFQHASTALDHNNQIALYGGVEDTNEFVPTIVHVIATGQPVPEDEEGELSFLGTVVLGPAEFHVFGNI